MSENSVPIIREFRPGDEAGICAAHVRSVRDLCAKDYGPEEIEAWIGTRKPQDYLDAMAKGERFHVIDMDGTIAGFSGWVGERILGFYIHPAFAGQGLGRALFRATEEDFLHRSGSRLCLITSTITARGFYQRMRFKMIEAKRHRLRSGREIDAFEMRKDYD